MRTLHVTNGDSAAEGLAGSGIPGDVLPWRDVLHDGPVPAGEDDGALRSARAAFLSRGQPAVEAEILADLVARDTRVASLTAGDTVVLWFEPDLYDQLQLMQVLAQLAALPVPDRPAISIVPADLLLGSLASAKFVPLHEQRRAITDADVALGRAAWRAFTAPSPEPLRAMVDEVSGRIPARTYAADTTVRLPYLASALRRVLEEYPDLESGLSRTERQVCEALASGPLTAAALFETAHHACEAWPWLGDRSFAWYLERLADGARPLLEQDNGARVVAPVHAAESRAFWDRRVQLTSFGVEVMRGRADAIRANGIDRWIGGVHLTTSAHWRWDARLQRPVPPRDTYI